MWIFEAEFEASPDALFVQPTEVVFIPSGIYQPAGSLRLGSLICCIKSVIFVCGTDIGIIPLKQYFKDLPMSLVNNIGISLVQLEK
jgi:hypothetical protein